MWWMYETMTCVRACFMVAALRLIIGQEMPKLAMEKPHPTSSIKTYQTHHCVPHKEQFVRFSSRSPLSTYTSHTSLQSRLFRELLWCPSNEYSHVFVQVQIVFVDYDQHCHVTTNSYIGKTLHKNPNGCKLQIVCKMIEYKGQW